MYPVLVPIDRDEDRADAQVGAVMRLPGATESVQVTLLHVFDDAAAADEESPAALEAGERARDQLESAGIDVELESRHGDPAEEILDAAAEIGAEQIILGGRKRSPLGSLVFGSVSQSVMLDASRPVTITGSDVVRDPSHRCQSCGETYHTRPEVTIRTCRNCGGSKVEPLETAPSP